MKNLSKKSLAATLRLLADRYWRDLTMRMLSDLNDVYVSPSDLRHVETVYRCFRDEVDGTKERMAALRSVAIWSDIDESYLDKMISQVHQLFTIELIREVLFHDFAREVLEDFTAKIEEAA
jgi:hypothetical protein